MGICCLKSKYKSQQDEPVVQEYKEPLSGENSNEFSPYLNEQSKVSGITDEERHCWIASQVSDPAEEDFFSK